MNKPFLLLVLVIMTSTYVSQAQSDTDCESKELFSMMPNHEVSRCEMKEFDSQTFYKSTANGNREALLKEGEKHTIWYHWLGDWEQRPSDAQIQKNYQNAIVKQGGELIYSGSELHFKLNKSGNLYYIALVTDGSGTYSVVTIRESNMKQDVVFSAKEIKLNMDRDGQLAFYGIFFDINKATIKPESSNSIKEIATYLKSETQKQVYLVGHTDNTGAHDYNVKLSKERAQAVVTELINKHSVPATQITAEGVGELSPVVNNNTEEGKAKNRRVVMVMKK